ncbi:MAG: PilZ domain-containing protein [Tepidiformaceae bacterium]
MNRGPSIEQGASIVVMLAAVRPPELRPASVLASKGERIVVRFDSDFAVELDALALVIFGQLGHRLVARAQCSGTKEGVYAFRLISPWQPFDGRLAPRYEMSLQAEVRSVLGVSRQAGLLIDVSLGGAAVTVPVRPGGKSIELGLTSGGFASRLPCEVVATTEREDSVILHLRWEALAPPQTAFLRRLIATAESDLAASYLRMAS